MGEDQGDQNVLSPKTGYTNQLDVLNSMARDIFVVDEIIHMWVLDLNEVWGYPLKKDILVSFKEGQNDL